MKAIAQDAYGGADVLELRDIPTPEVADDDVLVQVHAAGVDPGVWHVMTGLPYAVRLGYGLRKPKTSVRGTDVAGRVVAVGRSVTRFRPGDVVFGTSSGSSGSFAEYAIGTEKTLALKPANLSFEQAAAVPTSATTALQALRDAGRVRAGQRVLVIGASGGVGSFAVQIAKAFGASVTGVCSTQNVDRVRSLGADDVIDYTREDLAAHEAEFGLIVDTAGNRPLSQLRRLLSPKGTLVIVGAEGGNRWIGAMTRNLRSLAVGPFISQRLVGLFATQKLTDLFTVSELVRRGQVTPLIDRTYPLDQAPDAVRYLSAGHARGKVVVTVTPAAG